MTEDNLEMFQADRRQFLQLSGTGIALMFLGIGVAGAADAAAPLELEQKIVTGKMDGKPGWPRFEPANLVLPAHRLIQVTARCYDDGAADIPGGYNKVTGTTDGTMRLIKGQPKVIAADSGTIVTEIPVKDTAHTFTVNGDKFHMNIPIPVLGTVVYRFMTPAAGTYPWQCMAACGTGKGGWAGPMMANGWMEGNITVK